MAVYTQLFVHCVWATWDRLPLITAEAEEQLHKVMAGKCQQLGCSVKAIGGIEDHVHMLVEFVPTINIAQVIREVKGASSHAMTHSIAPQQFFKWQTGYGVFTVSKRSLTDVQAYIHDQKSRHARGSLIAELEHSSD